MSLSLCLCVLVALLFLHSSIDIRPSKTSAVFLLAKTAGRRKAQTISTWILTFDLIGQSSLFVAALYP